MNDWTAAMPNRPPCPQDGLLSADFTPPPVVGSQHTSQAEPALLRELRQVIAELQTENAGYERQIKELRGAIVALMEPDMPRILRTPGGIMVLDTP